MSGMKQKPVYSDDGKLYHIQVAPGEVGRYVLLPGDPKRCAKIAQYFDDPVLIADNREFVTYTGYLDGVKVSVTSTGIGGPSAAIAMEELVQAGADTFVRVGTCGGMDLAVKGGDIVVATAAIRAEGTSREYAPIEFPAVAHLDVVNAMVKAAKDLGAVCHTGVVQSKDSFYGQHSPETKPVASELQNKWKAWLQLGCKASEMEGAALMTVAAYLGVRCGACFLVMANQERAALGLSNPQARDTDLSVRVGVEAVRRLIAQDRAAVSLPQLCRMTAAEDPELQFTDMAVIGVDEIKVVPAYRKFCEENACGNYDNNYSCPPASGTVEEMERRLRSYGHALVLCSRYSVENALDPTEAAPLKKQHNMKVRRLVKQMKASGKMGDYLLILGGPCTLCDRCKKQTGESCPMEDERASCLSAYAIDVNELAKSSGMEISWDTRQVSYFSLIVY